MTCVISTRVKNIEIDDDKFILDTENGKYYSNIKKGRNSKKKPTLRSSSLYFRTANSRH